MIQRRRPKRRQRLNDLRIFSWNVRSLYRARAAQQLADALAPYKADLTALQEIRWPGNGVLQKKEYDIYYSGHPKHHVLGVGFLVSQKLKPTIIGFNAINERLCTLRVRGKFRNISLINVHGPTEESEEDEKDSYYELVERTLHACPRYDVKIILGDFNAKFGREPVFRQYIGTHSLHENTNDNGLRVIQMAASKNLVVASTRSPRKDIYKATWVSPDGVTRNQIDHVLIERRHNSSLKMIRTYRGANIDSDHYLVGMVFRERIAHERHLASAPQARINTAALRDENKSNIYSRALGLALVELDEGRVSPGDRVLGVDEKWTRLKSKVISTADTILGRSRIDRSDWFDDECKLATERKNVVYRAMQQSHRTRAREEEYKELRRTEKKLHRQKKAAWEKNIVCEIERNRERGPHQARKFYQSVRNMSQYTPRTTYCKDGEGNLITDPESILRRWEVHFNELLNGHLTEEIEAPSFQEENAMLQPPSIEEIEKAIKRLKNNKASGADGIPAELLKHGGPTLHQAIHEVIVHVWDREEMPEDWRKGILCPVHKKGDITMCSNYRGITLLSTAYKIFSSILQQRIAPYAETIIGKYQCGFIPGKSTIDQIFTLRQVMEKSLEFNIPIHHLFIDFKAAYDSIARVELYKAMREFGIPNKLIRLCRLTMTNTSSQVKIAGLLSRPINIFNGLRQGDGLACVLFNLALEKAIRDSGTSTRGTIVTKSSQILAYADDIDIIGRSQQAVQESFIQIERAAQNLGLHINEGKTKYMVASSARSVGPTVKVANHEFEVVPSFNYLGSKIAADNNLEEEIRGRLLKSNRTYFSLSKLFKSRNLTINSKLLLYKTMVLPVLTYGSETWVLTKRHSDLLTAFERKVLRRIVGPVCEEGRFRRRYNHELYEIYLEADVAEKIKLGRLRWAGHLARMSEEDPARKVLCSQFHGRRQRGRPCLRWRDGVDQDARSLGVRNWMASANNRNEWKNLLSEARTGSRLLRR